MALHVIERGIDRSLVRTANLRAQVIATEPEQHADRLRGRERQVEARDTRTTVAGGEGITGVRVVAAKHGTQRIVVDSAADLEFLRGRADPASGRLADAGVVVLYSLGDGLQVVALLPLAELSDRQHVRTESTACKCVRRFCTWRCGAASESGASARRSYFQRRLRTGL